MEAALLLRLLLLFVLPSVLLALKRIPTDFRYRVAFFVTIFMLWIILAERWSLHRLGFRLDNFFTALPAYLLFTLAGIIVLLGLARLLGRRPYEHWRLHPHFRFAFITLSFWQEFAFRAFLLPELILLTHNPGLAIIINALIFALPHAIYPHPAINTPLAFVGGLWLAALYFVYPNLLLISISHAALNFTAVLYGFMSLFEAAPEKLK